MCRIDVHAKLLAIPDDLPAIRIALIEHERFNDAIREPVATNEVSTLHKVEERPKRASVRSKLHRFEINEAQQSIISSLPSRAGKEFRKLCLRGKDVLIHRSIREGKSPLSNDSGHRSLKVALRLLMTGCTKGELKVAFMNELGWSDRSAQNEVSLMWSLLPALRVAIERRERLVVAPSLVAQNEGIA